jgi:hypothetical protein
LDRSVTGVEFVVQELKKSIACEGAKTEEKRSKKHHKNFAIFRPSLCVCLEEL